MSENGKEPRSLASTPTWSVATVLTVFVAVSLLVERSIHRLGHWLKKTNRKPLVATLEKMKEELMLLGFISLVLTATSRLISTICISSKFYDGKFSPCTREEIQDERVNISNEGRILMRFSDSYIPRRILNVLNRNSCPENYEPFVSYEGLEQLHRFIFVMAVTHVAYSCLTMLLAIIKIHTWRAWEDEARMDRHNTLSDVTRALTMHRQSTFVRAHTSNPMDRDRILVWVTCFFRQFGRSVVRADYLTMRQGFMLNHHLTSKYDFHSYMVRCTEEEFQSIVGISAPLWGFVVAFMLFNIKGSNLYFWIALIPVTLVLLIGTKLQHVIASLALESSQISSDDEHSMPSFKPRDELFWFNKPELLLYLLHFVLFQNSFELASFFWFWWQFGYDSCFIRNHALVYLRLVVGFAGQFLCSYSTLPLYALVTQMGTNYKAALIPERVRETMHGWRKEVKRRRRKMGVGFTDDSVVHTDTSTVISVEEKEDMDMEMDTITIETSSQPATPFLRPSISISAPVSRRFTSDVVTRSASMPHDRSSQVRRNVRSELHSSFGN